MIGQGYLVPHVGDHVVRRLGESGGKAVFVSEIRSHQIDAIVRRSQIFIDRPVARVTQYGIKVALSERRGPRHIPERLPRRRNTGGEQCDIGVR